MLHESNLCCSTCGMKEVLSRLNTLYFEFFYKARKWSHFSKKSTWKYRKIMDFFCSEFGKFFKENVYNCARLLIFYLLKRNTLYLWILHEYILILMFQKVSLCPPFKCGVNKVIQQVLVEILSTCRISLKVEYLIVGYCSTCHVRQKTLCKGFTCTQYQKRCGFSIIYGF